VPAKGRGIVTSGTMSTRPVARTWPDTNRSRRRRARERPSSAVGATRLASPADDGHPPRPAPITQTAKPVARSPTDLSRDLPCGHGRRTRRCPGRPCIDQARAPCEPRPTSWYTCAVGRLLWPLIPFRCLQPARPYDMDAAFMQFQRHGSGTHAVRPGTGDTTGAEGACWVRCSH